MTYSPAGSGQLLIYRLRLPTIDSNVSESLGDELESVGGGLTRIGRAFPVTVTVRGISSDLPDPYTAGQRLRRQLRSLMENTAFKNGGMYLNYLIDTELSGFFLIGGVDLLYSDGGFTLADYQLTLRDALRIGGKATHRSGRRFTVLDRRLLATPLDYRCLVYTVSYALYPGVPIVWLPYNVSDIRATTRQRLVPSPTGTYTPIDGSSSMQTVQPIDTLAVSFDHADADQLTGQVVAYDRKGITAPTLTAAGDADSQGVYGWEEVYGSIYPYTAGDVPVLANGICRVRYLSSVSGLVVEWNKNTTAVAYTEMCRVLFYEELVGGPAQVTTLLSAEVCEYSDDRAVVKMSLGVTNTQDIYISLQRGWSGPRIQQYTTTASEGASLYLIPFNSGATTISYRHNGSTTTIATTATLLDYQTASVGDEPWVNLAPVNTSVNMVATVNQTGMVMTAVADTIAYGATRNGVIVKTPYNAGTNPQPVPYWNAAKLEFYPSASALLATSQGFAGNAMFDARAYRTVMSRVP